jgi:ATPase subunit of ABC transporter with duplicated ATPase domains
MALFTQDDAHKNVLNLSGGKSARLVLANMIGQHDNVLILDEPTNHMDLESIDSLSSALKNFEGTVICVSHDRHFGSDIADRILILNEEELHLFNGSYQKFVSSL